MGGFLQGQSDLLFDWLISLIWGQELDPACIARDKTGIFKIKHFIVTVHIYTDSHD